MSLRVVKVYVIINFYTLLLFLLVCVAHVLIVILDVVSLFYLILNFLIFFNFLFSVLINGLIHNLILNFSVRIIFY